jgi:hypothetical protein
LTGRLGHILAQRIIEIASLRPVVLLQALTDASDVLVLGRLSLEPSELLPVLCAFPGSLVIGLLLGWQGEVVGIRSGLRRLFGGAEIRVNRIPEMSDPSH